MIPEIGTGIFSRYLCRKSTISSFSENPSFTHFSTLSLSSSEREAQVDGGIFCGIIPAVAAGMVDDGIEDGIILLRAICDGVGRVGGDAQQDSEGKWLLQYTASLFQLLALSIRCQCAFPFLKGSHPVRLNV